MRIGQKVYFRKKKSGSGPASIGEVVRKAGVITYLRDRLGEIFAVQTKSIEYCYVYVPYNKK